KKWMGDVERPRALPWAKGSQPFRLKKPADLPAFPNRFHLSRRGAFVEAAGADEAVVVELFDDVRGPAADARHREDRRVERDFELHRVIEAPARPVEVREHVLLGRHHAFDDVGGLFPLLKIALAVT